MGFRISTLDEARRLGPEVERAFLAERREAAPGRAGRVVPALNDKGQNKGESRLDAYLSELRADRKILWHAFESINLHLGPRTWLKVDFAVKLLTNRLALLDYKGGYRGDVREDSGIKLKLAARDFAWLGDVWIVRPGPRSSFLFYRVHPRSGISSVPDAGGTWMEGSS